MSLNRYTPKAILFGFLAYLMLVLTTITKSYDRYLVRKDDFSSSVELINFIESAFILWTLFLFFVPVIVRLIRNYPFHGIGFHRFLWIKHGLIHAITAFLVMILHAALYIVLIAYIRGYHDVFQFDFQFIRMMNANMTFYTIIDVFIYVCIVAGFYLVSYYEDIRIAQLRTLDLESQLSIVRLEALKMQIQPHFVFNALHNIHALLHEQVQAARESLYRLKSLMQRSHENLERQLISLKEELQFIEAYLGVEQTRFADRLKVYYEIDEIATQAVVPSMILQPAIEMQLNTAYQKVLLSELLKYRLKK
jgi:sensor histidine kinase YesM